MALSALSRPNFSITAYIPYMAGVLLLIVGLILAIAIKPGKGATAV